AASAAPAIAVHAEPVACSSVAIGPLVLVMAVDGQASTWLFDRTRSYQATMMAGSLQRTSLRHHAGSAGVDAVPRAAVASTADGSSRELTSSVLRVGRGDLLRLHVRRDHLGAELLGIDQPRGRVLDVARGARGVPLVVEPGEAAVEDRAPAVLV